VLAWPVVVLIVWALRTNINTASLADAALPNSRGAARGERSMHTLYIPHHDPPCLLMQVVGEIVGVAGGGDGVVARMYKRLHDRIDERNDRTLV
jgi:hypothetical protein